MNKAKAQALAFVLLVVMMAQVKALSSSFIETHDKFLVGDCL